VCRSIVFATAIERTDVLSLLKHGMRGLMPKNSPPDLIRKCIRKVWRGEIWIARHLIRDLVEALAHARFDEHEGPAADFRLTTREREILRRVLEADTNKGIAERLAVSEDTVKHHLTNIFDKTGASNRLELALFAIHHRLLT
jgi:DNA-binding NarL/FixJ family response regulator